MDKLNKYQFHIKTKNGITINPIQISAASQLSAEQTLFQMYHGCKIINVNADVADQQVGLDYQEVLNLITRH